jgi:hypothetical protein
MMELTNCRRKTAELLRLPRVNWVAVEATQAIGDADPGAKEESCTLIEYGASEAERCHQVLG